MAAPFQSFIVLTCLPEHQPGLFYTNDTQPLCLREIVLRFIVLSISILFLPAMEVVDKRGLLFSILIMVFKPKFKK